MLNWILNSSVTKLIGMNCKGGLVRPFVQPGVMNYCRNDTNEGFEKLISTEILEKLRKFDKRTLETKPMMARARKRIVFGANETKKLMELGKVKAVIVARNLNDEILLGKKTLD